MSTDTSYPYIKIFKEENKKKKEFDKKKTLKLEHDHLGYKSVIIDVKFINKGKWIVSLAIDSENVYVLSLYGTNKK